MDPESALDAVNAALETTEHADTPTETEDAAIADTGDGGESSGAESGAEKASEGGEEGGKEGAEGGEKPADADGSLERNPDGTFKKREAKPEGEKPAGEKPAEAKKPADPINDPLPKGLKAETQERIKTLITTAKEAQAQAAKATENFEVFVNGLQAAGVTPDQYGETLSYLSLFNKALAGDAKAGEAALQVLAEHAEKLSTFLGKDFSLSDPLAKHADLKDAVQKGQITAQLARELARTRNSQGFRGELSNNAARLTQQQQEQQQAVATARNELNALEAQLQASDPQYAAKKDLIVPILKPVLANLPPNQWKAAFEQAYAQARVAPAAAPKPAIPKNQPLRGNKMPSGGSVAAPASMLDAINGALGSMRR